MCRAVVVNHGSAALETWNLGVDRQISRQVHRGLSVLWSQRGPLAQRLGRSGFLG